MPHYGMITCARYCPQWTRSGPWKAFDLKLREKLCQTGSTHRCDRYNRYVLRTRREMVVYFNGDLLQTRPNIDVYFNGDLLQTRPNIDVYFTGDSLQTRPNIDDYFNGDLLQTGPNIDVYFNGYLLQTRPKIVVYFNGYLLQTRHKKLFTFWREALFNKTKETAVNFKLRLKLCPWRQNKWSDGYNSPLLPTGHKDCAKQVNVVTWGHLHENLLQGSWQVCLFVGWLVNVPATG